MTERRPSLLWSLVVDLAYLAAAPFVLAYLLVASRGLTRAKYRRGLLSKLWRTPKRAHGSGADRSFWVHAVSVGEVLTAIPLVDRLREAYPDWDVRVSVSTFTGFDVARARLGSLPVFYFPLDVSPIVARFFRRHRPTAVILVELEVWPNFLLTARRFGVPVLVANARITERSARRYAMGGPITRDLFNLVESFGAQNASYRDRLLGIGVDPARIEILGNLKHDRKPAPVAERGPEVRARLGWDRGETLVLVAGSTHSGEEQRFCSLYSDLRRTIPGLQMVVAPRHVERLDAGELSSWGAEGPLLLWSETKRNLEHAAERWPQNGILVVDTLGELELFYALADVVFVGGSLVPRGGHNLFEAARLEKALVFGTHFENFQQEGDLLREAGAAVLVADAAELRQRLEELLRSPGERDRLARAALGVTRRLAGATERHIEWIGKHLRLYLGSGAW